MKSRVNIFISLVLIALASGGMKADAQYRIDAGDFSELKVDNSVRVDYYCNADSAGIVMVDADPKSIQWLMFSNNGKGKLSIRTSAEYPHGEALPHVTIYSSKLEKLTNNGDSLVKTHGLVPVDRFKATMTGNGRISCHGIEAEKVSLALDTGSGQIIVSGKCVEASLRNIGTGTIQGDGLQADVVKASIIGTGSIGCDPTDCLTIMGAGSGTVYYRHEPAMIKNRGVGLHNSKL